MTLPAVVLGRGVRTVSNRKQKLEGPPSFGAHHDSHLISPCAHRSRFKATGVNCWGDLEGAQAPLGVWSNGGYLMG